VNKDLTVIIPVYNEEKAIRDFLLQIENAFKGSGFEYEIIIVDDASTDNTPAFLKLVKDKKTRVITHASNKGYGASLKTGVRNSSCEYIAIIDGDGSYPAEMIPCLFNELLKQGADMAVGARTGKTIEMSIFWKFGKFLLRKLAEYLSNRRIPDLNSGLRVIKKCFFDKFLVFLPDRFSITTTLTLFLLSHNYKIIYTPVDYYRRKGKSKIKPLRDILFFLRPAFKTAMFFSPLKIFVPPAFFFILVSFCIQWISGLLNNQMRTASVVFFTVGVSLLAVGFIRQMVHKPETA